MGGAENMLSRLILAMPEHEHHLVSLMSVSEIYSECLNKVESSHSLGWTLLSTPITIFRLSQVIDRIDADVIQCWMYHANVIGVLAHKISRNNSKILWGIHHSLSDYASESLSVKVALLASRLTKSLTGGIVYCSQVGREQHREFGIKGPPDYYVPNGVDPGIFTPIALCKKYDWNQIVVGVAGRFHEAKGYPYLLRAIRIIQNRNLLVHFYIAGKGIAADNSEFMKLFKEEGVSLQGVTLLGEVKHMPDFYRSLDLFVLSSITEGFPNVLVEAMAAGVVCIATEVGDAAIIVRGSGSVVPPKDAQSIAAAVLEYFHMSAEVKSRKSTDARLSVLHRYSITSVSKQYLDAWS